MKQNYSKQKYLLLSFLILIIFPIGCTNYLSDRSKSINSEGENNHLVTEARNFFESHASDLQPVNFGYDDKTKSTKKLSTIIPNWESAVMIQRGGIITVEVPLKGELSQLSRIVSQSKTKKAYGFVTRVTTKLVIQKHEQSGHYRQFVVTMIDDLLQSRKKDKTRIYSVKSDFSGYIIISSLEGKYLESFQSINDIWYRVGIVTGKDAVGADRIATLSLFSPDTPATSYTLGELDTKCDVCGNSLNLCFCCKYCNGAGCVECDVVVVGECNKCGHKKSECICCVWCENYPCTCVLCNDCEKYPCVCSDFICDKCGSKYCNGSCQSGGGVTPPKCTNAKCDKCGECLDSGCTICSKKCTCSYCSDAKCPLCGKCISARMTRSVNYCLPCECIYVPQQTNLDCFLTAMSYVAKLVGLNLTKTDIKNMFPTKDLLNNGVVTKEVPLIMNMVFKDDFENITAGNRDDMRGLLESNKILITNYAVTTSNGKLYGHAVVVVGYIDTGNGIIYTCLDPGTGEYGYKSSKDLEWKTSDGNDSADKFLVGVQSNYPPFYNYDK